VALNSPKSIEIDDETETKARLCKLARRLHQGWAKLYPVSEQALERVRRIVHTQFQCWLRHRFVTEYLHANGHVA
jgi:hypothetical protein